MYEVTGGTACLPTPTYGVTSLPSAGAGAGCRRLRPFIAVATADRFDGMPLCEDHISNSCCKSFIEVELFFHFSCPQKYNTAALIYFTMSKE